MGREPQNYRAELEQILEHFDGKRLLTRTEAAAYLGKSVDYCRDRMHITKDGVSAQALAMFLAKNCSISA